MNPLEPDPEDTGTKFEVYDAQMLIAYAMIAWAVVISLSIPDCLL